MLKKVLIIAEIAQAHDGSLGIAHSYIDALAQTGVDVVKFQTHIAQAESSEFEPFRVDFSYEDQSRFDYWNRMEFTTAGWAGLKKHCEEKAMEFLSSPFSCAAVDILENIGVDKYKIGSGELNNYLMLDKIARTGKPIILSSGMSDWAELDQTFNFLSSYNNELALLQCTTAYPTKPENWGLNLIPELKKRYKIPVGFSDHSATIHAGLAAVTLGAEILEFHVVFDRQMFGPDSQASLTIPETKTLVQGVRDITASMSSMYNRNNMDHLSEVKTIFGKSLCTNTDLQMGTVIELEHLESKKPGNMGISARNFTDVIGKKVNRNLPRWSFIQREHLM